MKTIFATLLLIALVNMFSALKLNGQCVAVGHVSAEIIESVSVSSSAVTNLTLGDKQSSNNDNCVCLGEMKINSGASVACNVVVQSGTLSNTKGDSVSIEPSASSSLKAENQFTEGNQTLRLAANTSSLKGMESGLYQGSYSVVFAYN